MLSNYETILITQAYRYDCQTKKEGSGINMWQALIKLVEKWACKHEWHLRTESYENFHTRQVWICWKCGKIKKIKL